MARGDLDRRNGLRALEALLVTLFSGDELYRWAFGFLPRNLAHELPGEGASPSKLAFAVVQLLERRGYIDNRLFESLREEFPRRCADIVRVEAYFRLPREAARAEEHLDPRTNETWRRRARTSLTLSCACLAIWLVPRLYPWSGFSRALKGLEKAIFSFLPIAYQGMGFLGVSVSAAAIAGVIWMLSARRE